MKTEKDLFKHADEEQVSLYSGVMVREILVRMCGNFMTGAMLSQIYSFYRAHVQGVIELPRHDGHLWIVKSLQQWANETSFKFEQVRYALKRLKELGLIETKTRNLNGQPVLHLRINPEQFLNSWKKLHRTGKEASEA